MSELASFVLRQLALRQPAVGRPRRERGDVPGWVMITIMTAGIVVALTYATQGTLVDMLNGAIASVKPLSK